jgi:hypothetical protein
MPMVLWAYYRTGHSLFGLWPFIRLTSQDIRNQSRHPGSEPPI